MESGLSIRGINIFFIVQQTSYFWPLLKVPAEKLMPHPKIIFESWFYNMDSELNFFVLKKVI